MKLFSRSAVYFGVSPRLVLIALVLLASGSAAAEPPGLGLCEPAARARLSRQLGLRSLDDLTVYEIDQAIDDVTGTFSGRVTLRFTNTTGRPLGLLPLLLHPNTSAELGAPGDAGTLEVTEVTAASPVSFAAVRQSLVEVRLPTPLAAGQRIAISVRYSGRLRRLAPNANDVFAQAMSSIGALSGGGAADYGLLAMGDGIVTAASAYPMLAPYRDGGFDTSRPARVGDLAYNGMAAFRVRTVVPAGLKIVTNLVDGRPAPVPGVGEVVVSEGAPVRDLILVAARDLAERSSRVGGTRVRSLFRERDTTAGQKVLEAAAAALGSFERRFGPYPYTELDVAEASLVGGAGGVEFSSMVLIAGMLYRSPDDSESPLAALMQMMSRLGGLLGGQAPGASQAERMGDLLDDTLEFTVAHEVAHQYFAGIVGNDSRRFPSLDEPLAQYAASLAIEDRRGAAAARAAMDSNVKMNYALYRLLGGRDRPVLRDTASFRTSIEYAALVYGKAPYLYVALRRSLGDAQLSAALRAAVARHEFRLVSTEEWIRALEAAAGPGSRTVRSTFRRYLDESHGDEDLGVDDSGDFVLDTMFPPEVAASLRQSLPILGMRPRDLLRMVFGGGLGDDAPIGPGIDPDAALRALEGLRNP
ncbi:MAG: hypothetical protein HYY06_26645 [Deltaproteobacteria bacterium]|nr:hypothetical protein [Deltaproteobacteria bacterium]